MGKLDQISEIVSKSEEALSELKQEIERIQQEDTEVENNALRRKNIELEDKNYSLQNSNEQLRIENSKLKNSLFERSFNERTKILDHSQKNIDVYFRMTAGAEENKLTAFERNMHNQINGLRDKMQQRRVPLENTVYEKLNKFQSRIAEEVEAIREIEEREKQRIYTERSIELTKLKNDPITGEQIVNRGKQTNLEVTLGLRIINRIGILLLVIGVVAAAQFTYTRVPDAAKGILIYLIGIAMLGLGEYFSRKKPNAFSIGLTSGGIAITYVATAMSYFLLGLLGMYSALGLCIITTLLAFMLSRRYNAQAIAAFAIIGGYLPLASISGNETLIYSAMIYFIILNVLSLMIATIKKWYVTQFVGFVSNIIAVIAVISQLNGVSGQSNITATIVVVYTFFAFMIYTLIPIVSSYQTKTKITIQDNIMLILNTFIGSCVICGAVDLFDKWDWAGWIFVSFTVLYVLMAKAIEKLLPQEKSSAVLFYITGITFAVLVIPIKLDVAYITLGWLIEGVLILCYGLYHNKKTFKRAGGIIYLLCVISLLTLDAFWGSDLMFYKHMYVTIGSIIIMGMLIYKGLQSKGLSVAFKCIMLVNLWLFMVHLMGDKIEPIIYAGVKNYALSEYMAMALAAVLGMIYAYYLLRTKLIPGLSTKIIAIAINIISIVIVALTNWNNGITAVDIPIHVKVIGTILLIAVNLLTLYTVYDLTTRMVLAGRIKIEWLPIVISVTFVSLLTQNLINLFDLSLNSIIITTILALTALGWIMFGFIRKYHHIRVSGLALSFVTTAKLFLIDLGSLTEGMRIIAYFMMGITLVTISFVYLHFTKRLESVE